MQVIVIPLRVSPTNHWHYHFINIVDYFELQIFCFGQKVIGHLLFEIVTSFSSSSSSSSSSYSSSSSSSYQVIPIIRG